VSHCSSQIVATDWDLVVEQGVQPLRRANSVAQHHDAVAGTSMQHVMDDYMEQLRQGVINATSTMEQLFPHLLFALGSKAEDIHTKVVTNPQPLLLQLNDTSPLSMSISLYNPLGWRVHEHYSIPIPHPRFIVKDANGTILPCQIDRRVARDYLLSDRDPYKLNYPFEVYPYEMTFPVHLPPVGYCSYTLSPIHPNDTTHHVNHIDNDDYYIWNDTNTDPNQKAGGGQHGHLGMANECILENGYLRLEFDTQSGSLQKITNKRLNQSMSVRQEYLSYTNGNGGAYGWSGTTPDSKARGNGRHYWWTLRNNGSLVTELVQHWANGLTTVWRLYNQSQHVHQRFATDTNREDMSSDDDDDRDWMHEGFVEVHHHIGTLEPDESLVTLYTTSLNTHDTQSSQPVFYQDDSGLEMVRRTKNNANTAVLNKAQITCIVFHMPFGCLFRAIISQWYPPHIFVRLIRLIYN
jgi:hypothetical protein